MPLQGEDQDMLMQIKGEKANKATKTSPKDAKTQRAAKKFVILPSQNHKSFAFLPEKTAKGLEKLANANFSQLKT